MKEEIYIAYIQKDLFGSISDSERDQLLAWRKVSEENDKLADQLYKAWDVSHQYGSEIEIDAEADYEKIQQKIKGSTSSPKRPKANKIVPFRIKRKWLSIAAGIAILITCAYIFIPQKQMTTILATADNQEILLPDGSKAFLSNGSRIKYSASFNDRREVFIEGVALLEVTSDVNNPFQVHSPHLQTTVLGTTFLVSDFAQTGDAEVQLLEGIVEVVNKADGEKILLKPEEGVVLDNEKLKKIQELDVSKYTWHFGNMNFKDVAIREVLEIIEKRFRIEIHINPMLEDCSFSANLSGVKIDQAVNAIANLYGATLEKKAQGYHISGGVCN